MAIAFYFHFVTRGNCGKTFCVSASFELCGFVCENAFTINNQQITMPPFGISIQFRFVAGKGNSRHKYEQRYKYCSCQLLHRCAPDLYSTAKRTSPGLCPERCHPFLNYKVKAPFVRRWVCRSGRAPGKRVDARRRTDEQCNYLFLSK